VIAFPAVIIVYVLDPDLKPLNVVPADRLCSLGD